MLSTRRRLTALDVLANYVHVICRKGKPPLLSAAGFLDVGYKSAWNDSWT